MAVISLDCPNCGAKLSPDDSTRRAQCQYCGTSFKLAKTIAQQAQRPSASGGVSSPAAVNPAAGRRAIGYVLAMTAIGVAASIYSTTAAIPSGALPTAFAGGSNFMWDNVGGQPVITNLDGGEQLVGRIRERGSEGQLHVAMFDAATGAERYRVGPLGSYNDAYRSAHFATYGDRLVVTNGSGKLLLFTLATGAPVGELALTDHVAHLCVFAETGAEPRLYLSQVDKRELVLDPIEVALTEVTLPPACKQQRIHWGREGDPVAASDERVALAPKVDGIKVQAVQLDGALAVARGVKSPGTAYPLAFGFDPETREVRWNGPVAAVDLASVRVNDNHQDALVAGRYFATYGEGREHWHLTAFDAETGARLWDNKLRSIFAVDWLYGLLASEEHVFLVRMQTVEVYDARTGALKTTISHENYDG